MFSYQVIRESDDCEYLAVIRAFKKNKNNNVIGAVVYHPHCEIKSNYSNEVENYEEFIPLKDLVHDILISNDNNNFVPFISNRNDFVGRKCRESDEENEQPAHCFCKLKAKKRAV